MEDPVHAVLVIRGGEDLRNDKFSASRDDYGVVAEVGVFEENARVFLMDTDGVFDYDGGAGFICEGCVEVVNYAFAVAAQTNPHESELFLSGNQREDLTRGNWSCSQRRIPPYQTHVFCDADIPDFHTAPPSPPTTYGKTTA